MKIKGLLRDHSGQSIHRPAISGYGKNGPAIFEVSFFKDDKPMSSDSSEDSQVQFSRCGLNLYLPVN